MGLRSRICEGNENALQPLVTEYCQQSSEAKMAGNAESQGKYNGWPKENPESDVYADISLESALAS